MAGLAADEEGQATTRPASQSMLELEESLLDSRAENKAEKTVCIKTFLRPECLARCVRSVRTWLPGVRVLVCDDGREDEQPEESLAERRPKRSLVPSRRVTDNALNGAR